MTASSALSAADAARPRSSEKLVYYLKKTSVRGARLAEVDLTGDFDQREIGTCGGIMDVFVDLWSPARDLPIARQLADAASRSAPGALLTVVDAGSRAEMLAGSRTFIDPSRDRRARRSADRSARGGGRANRRANRRRDSDLARSADDGGCLQPVTRLEPNGCGAVVRRSDRRRAAADNRRRRPYRGAAVRAGCDARVSRHGDRRSRVVCEPRAVSRRRRNHRQAVHGRDRLARARRPLLPGFRDARSFVR